MASSDYIAPTITILFEEGQVSSDYLIGSFAPVNINPCVCTGPVIDASTTGLASAVILVPVRFLATTYNVKVVCGGVTNTLAFPASGSLVLGRNYWTAADSQADGSAHGGPGDLIAILLTALNANAGGVTWSASSSTTGFLTLICSGGNGQILWADGATTLDPTIFGFTASNTASSSSIAAPNQCRGWWCPRRALWTDSEDWQPMVGSIKPALSGLQTTTILSSAAKKEREVAFDLVTRPLTLSRYTPATEPYGSFEHNWVNSIALGRPLRLYENINLGRTTDTYRLYLNRSLKKPYAMSAEYNVRWSVTLALREAP